MTRQYRYPVRMLAWCYRTKLIRKNSTRLKLEVERPKGQQGKFRGTMFSIIEMAMRTEYHHIRRTCSCLTKWLVTPIRILAANNLLTELFASANISDCWPSALCRCKIACAESAVCVQPNNKSKSSDKLQYTSKSANNNLRLDKKILFSEST